jgi:hypothetical protein
VADRSPAQVAGDFRRLLAGGRTLRADGQAREDPTALLRGGYTPKYVVELFGTVFFLANQRDVDGIKVLPAYVLPAASGQRRNANVYARVFYKDSSLVWRSPSHYVNTPTEKWIGKGAVKPISKHGVTEWISAEETTNLPFELQAALDDVSRRGPRSRPDRRLLTLVLRNAPAGRVWPYRDFEAPRALAMQQRANQINGNQPIAWFADAADPASLRFRPGFEPAFSAMIDRSTARSTMYGGTVEKYRFASRNGQIQYLFVAGPRHVWIVHPQAFTTQLSSYGLRTVDVSIDDDLCIPGYEFYDHDGAGAADDQIPPGFAGETCPFDPDRADASPWNDRLPPVRAFRRWQAARSARQG